MSNKQKYRGVDVSELCFDKMSNEGGYNALPRTKIRFGGFGGSSRAIRKIHIVAVWETFLPFCEGCQRKRRSLLFLLPEYPSFYYLPICWYGTPSGEWNSLLFTSIFQRFDFRARNNCVWQVKLYCLTRQTILFGSRNNIVPGTFCLFFENRMYSFLKSRSFSGLFIHIRSRSRAGLPDFWKVRVSRKHWNPQIMSAKRG